MTSRRLREIVHELLTAESWAPCMRRVALRDYRDLRYWWEMLYLWYAVTMHRLSGGK